MTTLAHEFENTAEVDVKPSVLDRKEALQRVMDDVDLLRTVFEIFFEDCPEQLRRIEEAVEANDGTTLQSSAHALKSALGNLAAHTAHRCAHRLEQMGTEQSLAGTAELVTELKQQIITLRSEANSFLATLLDA